MPPFFPALSRLRRPLALRSLALAAVCTLPGAALAQQGAALPALRLKASPALTESLPAPDTALPTFVRGERITGGGGTATAVEGDAELRKAGMTLRSATLQHDARHDIARSDSSVRLNHAGNLYQGSSARMQVDAHEAVVHHPSYRLLANGAHGTAQRLDMLDASRATVWGGTYTTCQCEDENGKPDWILRAKELTLDNEEGVGRAKNAVLEFKGLPLLPLPALSFPLNSQRRSGLLPPTIGLDNKSGLSFLQPYYFNIAPNRDATLWPHLMLRRGLDLGGQFRYLEQSYRGRISAHYLAGDRLRHRDRWGIFTRHNGTLRPAIGPVGVYLNLNRVSDAEHWRDFSSRGNAFNTTRLLASEGGAVWRRGHFSFSALASKWQTLQSVGDSVIVPPYDRLPSFTARYARLNHRGFDYLAEANFTRFRGERSLTRQADADRAHVLVQVARPFEWPWGFVIPKAQVHSAHYSFSGAGGATPKNQQRTVPTFSLDSGLVFERSTRLAGRPLLQTLEPRLKYVYTPYRDQSSIPRYDTNAYDFNFATIWAENPYTGHDRIADNKLITAGVTTRFIDPASGAEKLRLAVAQRYRFTPQRLTGTDRGWSDMMLGAGLHWNPHWSFDSTVQYNTHTRRSTRSTVHARYTPGPYRSLNLAYRWQRRQYPRSSEFIDIAWQWPLGRLGELGTSHSSSSGACGRGRWYSAGRLNYSRSDHHMVDGVLGVEYDAGCWISRLVLEKTNLSSSSATKRVLFQIEFRGLGRVGNNPLAALRAHIPRYQPLGESVAPTASRFHSYD